MKSELCEKLGIEFPIFAFNHCRDVIVEVSKAGGMGILGAAGLSPEALEIELKWIDLLQRLHVIILQLLNQLQE